MGVSDCGHLVADGGIVGLLAYVTSSLVGTTYHAHVLAYVYVYILFSYFITMRVTMVDV